MAGQPIIQITEKTDVQNESLIACFIEINKRVKILIYLKHRLLEQFSGAAENKLLINNSIVIKANKELKNPANNKVTKTANKHLNQPGHPFIKAKAKEVAILKRQEQQKPIAHRKPLLTKKINNRDSKATKSQ
jgi:hypothetical protein